MDLKEKIMEALWAEGYLEMPLEKIANIVIATLSDLTKGIEWVGECNCKNPISWVGEWPCTRCDQGTITRPATIEEVVEVTVRILTTPVLVFLDTITINNGTLRLNQ